MQNLQALVRKADEGQATRDELEELVGVCVQMLGEDGNPRLRYYADTAEVGSLDPYTDEQLAGIGIFLWELLPDSQW